VLQATLRSGEKAWLNGLTKGECIRESIDFFENRRVAAAQNGVEIKLDYVEMNDPHTFDILDAGLKRGDMINPLDAVILSGAMWVGKTRLIDNIILGDASQILR
jgi:pantoate--beta-alanine ligase